MEQKRMTDMARNNKNTMKAHWIMVCVMCTFIFLQATAGISGWLYVLVCMVLGLAAPIMELVYWRKDRESVMIKYLVAYGFAVFYTFVLFTSPHGMVYVFVIPMILAISVYNDRVYSLKVNIGTTIESIIIVVLGASTGKFGYMGMDAGIIQIVIMILVGTYSVMSSKTIQQNMAQKLDDVNDAKKSTEQSLNSITALSSVMKEGIEEINQGIQVLQEASVKTKIAMTEVSDGSKDMAEAVQEQLNQTDAIQNKVIYVNNDTADISANMEETMHRLNDGNHNMEQLVEQVDATVEHSVIASENLELLNGYMEQMHTIVEVINGITNQTSMLALNASIEAARAGEAGRGFAVVATEITGMAAKTKDATLNIEELISNVSSAIEDVVRVIKEMIQDIQEEKRGVENVKQSFQVIYDNTLATKKNVVTLSENVDELREANAGIAESIQTISSITEEVTAHASETVDAEEKNVRILNKIVDRMEQLRNEIQ